MKIFYLKRTTLRSHMRRLKYYIRFYFRNLLSHFKRIIFLGWHILLHFYFFSQLIKSLWIRFSHNNSKNQTYRINIYINGRKNHLLIEVCLLISSDDNGCSSMSRPYLFFIYSSYSGIVSRIPSSIFGDNLHKNQPNRPKGAKKHKAFLFS